MNEQIQYIGARYVIKIYENKSNPRTAEWDSDTFYEPLTLVTFEYNSYLSRKAVPTSVGNPAANSEYWAQTGYYSGQIMELQNRVANLAEGLSDEALARSTKDGLLDDDISALRTADTNLQNNINKVNSPTLRSMSTRKFVFVGDSYTQMPTPSTSFVGLLKNYLGLSDNQIRNIGVSGVNLSGFISQVNNYSYDDTSAITDVVVVGGINDAHVMASSSDLNTKIPQLISAIRSKFPNAIIWAGFAGGGYYTNLVGDYAGFTYENVQNIRNLWENNFEGSPYVIYMPNLDTWWRNLVETDFFTSGGSGLHPKGYGIICLAKKIANFLKGGPSVTYDSTYGTTTPIVFGQETSLWVGVKTFSYHKYDHREFVKLPHGGANLEEAMTFSNATSFTLVTQNINTSVESNAITCMKDITVSTPLFYQVQGDSSYKVIEAEFTLKDRSVIVNTPNALNAISNVVSLWWPEITFEVPANAI